MYILVCACLRACVCVGEPSVAKEGWTVKGEEVGRAREGEEGEGRRAEEGERRAGGRAEQGTKKMFAVWNYARPRWLQGV